MRRLLIILSIVCISFLVTSFFVKSAIMMLARKQLGNIFIQSRVLVQGCSFKPGGELRLLGITIKKLGIYEVKIKEASVQYDLFSLFKPGSLKLILKEVSIFLNTPENGVRELPDYLRLGLGGRPLFGKVSVSDFSLDLNTHDLKVKASLSSAIDILGQSVDYLDLKLDNFKLSGVQFEDAYFELKPGSVQGNFNLARIKYDKLNITDIKGAFKLEGKLLSLSRVSARAFGGDLLGELSSTIDEEVQYAARLECRGLDIEKFIQDFNLQEKFDMTGRLSGELKLEGRALRLGMVRGDFSALEPGGTLVIKDTKFLEDMAQRTKQPLDLLVESFRNYGYNMGVVAIGIEESNIILKIALEGQAGKRNLSVVLHNFNLGGK
jgi:hypothetical protein